MKEPLKKLLFTLGIVTLGLILLTLIEKVFFIEIPQLIWLIVGLTVGVTSADIYKKFFGRKKTQDSE